MDYKDFLSELDSEVEDIHASYFDIEITDTYWVPTQDDNNLTYENFDSYSKKVKTIETCVLFIDIRKSTAISLKNDAVKMTKLYTSFSRAMVKIAEKTGGKVRNIIGDRVMVVYDHIGCCEKAIETAILMSIATKSIINKHFKDANVKCGIGIDYGKMLVSKCGSIKQGKENSHYKYLVWAGKTANVASKLTDSANKFIYKTKEVEGVNVGLHYPLTDKWSWTFHTVKQLVEKLRFTYTPTIYFKEQYFSSFFATSNTEVIDNFTFPPILLTKSVLENLKLENPKNEHLVNIKRIFKKIENVDDDIYGINV